ncbi:MAG: glutaredoxin 3 [Proteobacteria bacterium]|nr:glutaredoxin 3 [Pseudomonadota bacterium]
MAEVVMYCTHACPYCRMASQLLEKKGAKVNKIQVDEQPDERVKMSEMTGRNTVPQIFIGDRHVGGYTDIVELDMEDELDGLLQA